MQHVIAEQILGRELDKNEVVHHLDENPKNNKLINLIVLMRKYHGKLHFYLRNRSLLIEDYEKIKIQDSLDWLNKNNIMYIKLWNINKDNKKANT